MRIFPKATKVLKITNMAKKDYETPVLEWITWRAKLPREIHASVSEFAQKEMRSITSMIVILLREALNARTSLVIKQYTDFQNLVEHSDPAAKVGKHLKYNHGNRRTK